MMKFLSIIVGSALLFFSIGDTVSYGLIGGLVGSLVSFVGYKIEKYYHVELKPCPRCESRTLECGVFSRKAVPFEPILDRYDIFCKSCHFRFWHEYNLSQKEGGEADNYGYGVSKLQVIYLWNHHEWRVVSIEEGNHYYQNGSFGSTTSIIKSENQYDWEKRSIRKYDWEGYAFPKSIPDVKQDIEKDKISIVNTDCKTSTDKQIAKEEAIIDDILNTIDSVKDINSNDNVKKEICFSDEEAIKHLKPCPLCKCTNFRIKCFHIYNVKIFRITCSGCGFSKEKEANDNVEIAIFWNNEFENNSGLNPCPECGSDNLNFRSDCGCCCHCGFKTSYGYTLSEARDKWNGFLNRCPECDGGVSKIFGSNVECNLCRNFKSRLLKGSTTAFWNAKVRLVKILKAERVKLERVKLERVKLETNAKVKQSSKESIQKVACPECKSINVNHYLGCTSETLKRSEYFSCIDCGLQWNECQHSNEEDSIKIINEQKINPCPVCRNVDVTCTCRGYTSLEDRDYFCCNCRGCGFEGCRHFRPSDAIKSWNIFPLLKSCPKCLSHDRTFKNRLDAPNGSFLQCKICHFLMGTYIDNDWDHVFRLWNEKTFDLTKKENKIALT